jgi:hypothetical protein
LGLLAVLRTGGISTPPLLTPSFLTLSSSKALKKGC